MRQIKPKNHNNLSLCDTSMKIGMNNVLDILVWKKPVATWKIQDGGYFQDGRHVNILKGHFGKEFNLMYLIERSMFVYMYFDMPKL